MMGLDPGGAVEMMKNGQILLTFWLRHHMGAQGQNQVFICQQSVCSRSAKGCEASQAQAPGLQGRACLSPQLLGADSVYLSFPDC